LLQPPGACGYILRRGDLLDSQAGDLLDGVADDLGEARIASQELPVE